jgi:hypothetical protein
MKRGPCEECGSETQALDDEAPLQCQRHTKRTPGEQLYHDELGGLETEGPRYYELPRSKRAEFERRAAMGEPKTPTLAEIREAVEHPERMHKINAWAALRACIAELDERGREKVDAEAEFARGAVSLGALGSFTVRLDSSLLLRFGILRSLLPGLLQLVSSMDLDELHAELKPHARRLVLLLEGAIDQYRQAEEKEGRTL